MENLILPDTLELVITAQVVRDSENFLSNTDCHIANAAKAALELPEGYYFNVDCSHVDLCNSSRCRTARYEMAGDYNPDDYLNSEHAVTEDTPSDTIIATRTATLQK